MRMLSTLTLVLLAQFAAANEWNKDAGKAAPEFTAAGWVGNPVSLDAVKGNTVIIAFWNADIAC